MKNGYAFSKSSLCAWMKMLVLVILTFTALYLPSKAEAASPPRGLTIITHGWLSDSTTWVNEMAEEIKSRIGENVKIDTIKILRSGISSDAYLDPDNPKINIDDDNHKGSAVILVDWPSGGLCNSLYPAIPTRKIGNLIAEYLSKSISESGHKIVEVPIHLIGHSRGASVMSRVAYYLGSNGIWVDQMTTLDPHPLDCIPPDEDDWDVSAWSNVLFADNYYQRYTTGLWGEHVDGTYELNLTDTITDFLFYAYHCDGSPKILSMYSAHEYIHS